MRTSSCLVLAASLVFAASHVHAASWRMYAGGRFDTWVVVDGKFVYVDMNATAVETLNPGPPTEEWEENWVLGGNSPYKHAFVAYNPAGHPAFDGFGGGYGPHHIDLHFFVITEEERKAKAVCSSIPCTPDNVSEAVFNFPDSKFIPDDFYTDFSFGGHGVAGHGMHWLPKKDLAIVTPLDNDDYLDGPEPRWLACLRQKLGGDDEGCRLAKWQPGISPVFITLDGKVAAHELMFSMDFITRLKSMGFYYESFPPVRERVTDYEPALYPSDYFAAYNPETDRVRMGLLMGKYKYGAVCPEECAECDDEFKCISCSNPNHGVLNGACRKCRGMVDGFCVQRPVRCLSVLDEEGDTNCVTDKTYSRCKMDAIWQPYECPVRSSCHGAISNCGACRFTHRHGGTATCVRCMEGYALVNNACEPLQAGP